MNEAFVNQTSDSNAAGAIAAPGSSINWRSVGVLATWMLLIAGSWALVVGLGWLAYVGLRFAGVV